MVQRWICAKFDSRARVKIITPMKVLVTDPITKSGISILEEANINVVQLNNASVDDKLNACVDAAGWIVRSGTSIDPKAIKAAKRLRVIGRAGVGVDNIDISAATRGGIVVMNTPDVNTISAAEHTIAMMLALSRNISIGDLEIKQKKWNRHLLVGSEIKNKTLGIIGLGKIGKEVMKRCLPFGMNVIGFDPFVNQEMFNQEEIKIVELDELTRNADFVTIHVPLNDKTRDLFNFNRLKSMKKTARIINVSRGGIINEQDLAKALTNKEIAGAAIDVFAQEPIEKDNPLIDAPNILLTPHLGASTKEAKEGVSISICEQLRDYLLEEKLSNAINMPISDLSTMKEIQPSLDLAETMGRLQDQLNPEAIKKIQVECSGSLEDSKPIALAFLKGFLGRRIPERINYINSEALAIDLGIKIEHSYTNDSGSYTNLIRTRVSGISKPTRIAGSIFGQNEPRLVNILGFDIDVKPYGYMLFAKNKDVPGVIGKVGTALGDFNVNIGGFILSRAEKGQAFSVVRVDNMISDENLSELRKIPEIISLKQLTCDEYSS